MSYITNETYKIYLSNEYNSNTYYLTPNMSSKIINNDIYYILTTEKTYGNFNGLYLTIEIELLYYEEINTFKINNIRIQSPDSSYYSFIVNNHFSIQYTSIGYDQQEHRYIPENNSNLLLYTSSKISFTFDKENNSIIIDTDHFI